VYVGSHCGRSVNAVSMRVHPCRGQHDNRGCKMQEQCLDCATGDVVQDCVRDGDEQQEMMSRTGAG